MAAVLDWAAMVLPPEPSASLAPSHYAAVIFGAGPAGMSCAEALANFGLSPCVIERAAHIGGAQRNNFHPNLWLLGAPNESGAAMTERLCQHYQTLSLPTLHSSQAQRVAPRTGGGFVIDLSTPAGPMCIETFAIVLTTGTRPRATDALAALARRSRRVLIGPIDASLYEAMQQAHVLILGGGDNAFDHARLLAERGNRVTVCARGRFSARPAFHAACARRPEIALRAHCQAEIVAAGENEIFIRFAAGDTQRFDWLLVLYGYQPNSEWLTVFEPHIRPRLLASGHVVVDAWQRTDIAGIYAAGDLTAAPQPSVVVAMAQGLVAARAIERDWAQRRRVGSDSV